MKHQATSHLTTHNPSPMKKKIFLEYTFHSLAGGLKQEPVTWWIITDKPLSHAFGVWKEQKAWERETLSASTENLTKEPQICMMPKSLGRPSSGCLQRWPWPCCPWTARWGRATCHRRRPWCQTPHRTPGLKMTKLLIGSCTEQT